MKSQSGFSLLELMVVCGIILVLVAFMLPAVVSSMQTSNETNATNTLRQVVTAENSYFQLYPPLGYSTTAAKLGGVYDVAKCPNIPDPLGTWSCLVPDAQALKLDSGSMGGYKFVYTPGSGTPQTSWSLTATPTASLNGRKSYCVDNSGVVRYVFGLTPPTTDAVAGCTSGTVLGQ